MSTLVARRLRWERPDRSRRSLPADMATFTVAPRGCRSCYHPRRHCRCGHRGLDNARKTAKAATRTMLDTERGEGGGERGQEGVGEGRQG